MKIITARIDSIFVSSTAVLIYDFHIFTALGGLFGSNIMTNSQMARYLSWYSAAPVWQRSWVQIPYGPEFFFRPFFKYQFITARIDSILVSSHA